MPASHQHKIEFPLPLENVKGQSTSNNCEKMLAQNKMPAMGSSPPPHCASIHTTQPPNLQTSSWVSIVKKNSPEAVSSSPSSWANITTPPSTNSALGSSAGITTFGRRRDSSISSVSTWSMQSSVSSTSLTLQDDDLLASSDVLFGSMDSDDDEADVYRQVTTRQIGDAAQGVGEGEPLLMASPVSNTAYELDHQLEHALHSGVRVSESSIDVSTSTILDTLTSNIEAFIQDVDVKCKAMQSDENQDSVVSTVNEIISECFPSAQVHVYGSLSTDLWLPAHSDLDLVLHFKQKNPVSANDRIALLHTLQEHFAVNYVESCKDVSLIRASSMPVVKLTFLSKRGKPIPIDISVFTENEHKGMETSDFVQSLHKRFPGTFRAIVLVVKKLLYVNDLHNVYQGGLGSYALILLVTFFLQECEQYRESHKHMQRTGSSPRNAADKLAHDLPKKLNPYHTENHATAIAQAKDLLDQILEEVDDQRDPTTGQHRTERLLLGFLEFFAKFDNLAVGFSFSGRTQKLVSNSMMDNLHIQNPVSPDLFIGRASYKMHEIQNMFRTVLENLLTGEMELEQLLAETLPRPKEHKVVSRFQSLVASCLHRDQQHGQQHEQQGQQHEQQHGQQHEQQHGQQHEQQHEQQDKQQHCQQQPQHQQTPAVGLVHPTGNPLSNTSPKHHVPASPLRQKHHDPTSLPLKLEDFPPVAHLNNSRKAAKPAYSVAQGVWAAKKIPVADTKHNAHQSIGGSKKTVGGKKMVSGTTMNNGEMAAKEPHKSKVSPSHAHNNIHPQDEYPGLCVGSMRHTGPAAVSTARAPGYAGWNVAPQYAALTANNSPVWVLPPQPPVQHLGEWIAPGGYPMQQHGSHWSSLAAGEVVRAQHCSNARHHHAGGKASNGKPHPSSAAATRSGKGKQNGGRGKARNAGGNSNQHGKKKQDANGDDGSYSLKTRVRVRHKRTKGKCVFIGNIDYLATQQEKDQLLAEFRKYGSVTHIHESGLKFWLQYETQAAADKVVQEKHGVAFLRRPLVVEYSTNREATSGGKGR